MEFIGTVIAEYSNDTSAKYTEINDTHILRSSAYQTK